MSPSTMNPLKVDRSKTTMMKTSLLRSEPIGISKDIHGPANLQTITAKGLPTRQSILKKIYWKIKGKDKSS